MRKKLRSQAEGEVKMELKRVREVIDTAAADLGCAREDVVRALLPRNSTVMAKLVKNRIDGIENALIDRYMDTEAANAKG
jgi:hypothetical protein